MTPKSAIVFAPYRPEMAASLVTMWNEAGQGHPITPGLWVHCTSADPYFRDADVEVALADRRPVGFAIAKRYRGEDPGCRMFADVGWIALLAVAPGWQRRGVGRQLLDRAEARLRGEGVARIYAGGSFWHFTPGVPAALPGAVAFLRGRGYGGDGACWDVRGDLAAFQVPPSCRTALDDARTEVRPFTLSEAAALLKLLAAGGFAPRWHHDAAAWLRAGGPIDAFVGLWRGEQPVGFAWIHPPGAQANLRWQGFGEQITALGPIGVASSERGRGLGLALLALALERLRVQGARTTVIDWTTLLDFYGRVGFRPWLRYEKLLKVL